ncbi:MAG: hypothetical protein OHK0015_28690 [Chloroflexi bacterium OHK40]
MHGVPANEHGDRAHKRDGGRHKEEQDVHYCTRGKRTISNGQGRSPGRRITNQSARAGLGGG